MYDLDALVLDLDGTLCEHGKPVIDQMAEQLHRFKREVMPDKPIVLATASSLESVKTRAANIIDVFDLLHCNLSTRVYDRNQKLLHAAPAKSIEGLVMKILEEKRLKSSFYYKSTPFIAAKPPYYSFSVIGKNYPPEHRHDYIIHDLETNERDWICHSINVIQSNWRAFKGGQTGIDIVPIGYGKQRVLSDLKGRIGFMADDMGECGGDYPLKRELFWAGNHRYVWDVSGGAVSTGINNAYMILENEIADHAKRVQREVEGRNRTVDDGAGEASPSRTIGEVSDNSKSISGPATRADTDLLGA